MRFITEYKSWKKTIYEYDWRSIVPDKLTIIKEDTTDRFGYIKGTKTKCEYKIGNIMSNLIHQITYDRNFDVKGIPDTLEMDISVIKNENNNKFKMQVEITFGDLVVSEFTIEYPNKISIIVNTSKGSKFDPSDTIFAFDEVSLNKLIKFFNSFDHLDLKISDLNFLRSNQ